MASDNSVSDVHLTYYQSVLVVVASTQVDRASWTCNH